MAGVAGRSGRPDTLWISYSELAAEQGKSDRSARRWIDRLAEFHLIEVVERAANQVRVYVKEPREVCRARGTEGITERPIIAQLENPPSSADVHTPSAGHIEQASGLAQRAVDGGRPPDHGGSAAEPPHNRRTSAAATFGEVLRARAPLPSAPSEPSEPLNTEGTDPRSAAPAAAVPPHNRRDVDDGSDRRRDRRGGRPLDGRRRPGPTATAGRRPRAANCGPRRRSKVAAVTVRARGTCDRRRAAAVERARRDVRAPGKGLPERPIASALDLLRRHRTAHLRTARNRLAEATGASNARLIFDAADRCGRGTIMPSCRVVRRPGAEVDTRGLPGRRRGSALVTSDPRASVFHRFGRFRRFRENRQERAQMATTPAGHNEATASTTVDAEHLVDETGERPSTRPGRDCRGRFSAGTAPGPGRPKKTSRPATPAAAEKRASQLDANELFFRGMMLRDLDAGWRHIIVSFSPRVVYQLVAEAITTGEEIPDVVIDFLSREGLWGKAAKHRLGGDVAGGGSNRMITTPTTFTGCAFCAAQPPQRVEVPLDIWQSVVPDAAQDQPICDSCMATLVASKFVEPHALCRPVAAASRVR